MMKSSFPLQLMAAAASTDGHTDSCTGLMCP